MLDSILDNFPEYIRNTIKSEISQNVEEIRVRVEKPIILKYESYEKIINVKISQETIIQILQRICDNSIYSYQNQICNGFITIKGGHRVGICGSAVIENNKIINLNYISGLNFRIAKQILGVSNNIISYIINGDTVYNTLIVSPPGAGKTTLLRDIIRNISNGIDKINFKPLTVGVVDERGEIAAKYRGIAQNDLGIRTDVMDNISKQKGITMLVRSMSPNVIVADEIGAKEDIEAINYCVNSRG